MSVDAGLTVSIVLSSVTYAYEWEGYFANMFAKRKWLSVKVAGLRIKALSLHVARRVTLHNSFVPRCLLSISFIYSALMQAETFIKGTLYRIRPSESNNGSLRQNISPQRLRYKG